MLGYNVETLLSETKVNFKKNKTRYIFLLAAAASSVMCFVLSNRYYTGEINGSMFIWIAWLAGMLFFITAFIPGYILRKPGTGRVKINSVILVLMLILFFTLTHLWNWETAPWNHNGLFDDAAWNIYFLKSYVMEGLPFQGAVHEAIHPNPREVIYHYYMAALFYLFGQDLLVFNAGLLVLGFITFLFTVLLIHRMFKNYIVTAMSAVILNYFPLHYIFTFVGQRYAIVAPLMMISVYFLYSGFKEKSYFKMSVSSIFAGLCFSSAIMGRQYLVGLAGGLIIALIFNFKKTFTEVNWNLTKVFVVGTIISSIPLLMYIAFNKTSYFANESHYMNAFLDTLKRQGFEGFKSFCLRMKDCLFGFSWYKWFIPDYPLIPIPYYLFLIPGMMIAFCRKQYYLITVALVPPAGAFISGFSDYRVLMSCPVWIVLMAFTINEMVKFKYGLVKENYFIKNFKKYSSRLIKRFKYKLITLPAAVIIIAVTVIPCINYICEKSKDPYSIRFFAQKDVAVSRFVRDIAAGVPDPSSDFRRNEFVRLHKYPDPDFDTFVCQNLGYAITHTFLYEYDDMKIMSFSDGLPFNLLNEKRILEINKRVIRNYQKTSKDLKLVWEVTDKTNKIVDRFRKLSVLGSDETYTGEHEGRRFVIYELYITNRNIDKFRNEVENITI